MKSNIIIIGQDKTSILNPKEDIRYLHSQGDQGTIIHLTNNTKLFTSYRFKRFVEGLCPFTFAKSSKSYLVNLGHIKEIKKEQIKLSNGQLIPIINGYHNRILNKFLMI